jgi:H+/Cl- antiporter ClcA
MTVLPGLFLAVVLALAGEYLSKLIGTDLMGFSKSPVSPILMAIILGTIIQ